MLYVMHIKQYYSTNLHIHVPDELAENFYSHLKYVRMQLSTCSTTTLQVKECANTQGHSKDMFVPDKC